MTPKTNRLELKLSSKSLSVNKMQMADAWLLFPLGGQLFPLKSTLCAFSIILALAVVELHQQSALNSTFLKWDFVANLSAPCSNKPPTDISLNWATPLFFSTALEP